MVVDQIRVDFVDLARDVGTKRIGTYRYCADLFVGQHNNLSRRQTRGCKEVLPRLRREVAVVGHQHAIPERGEVVAPEVAPLRQRMLRHDEDGFTREAEVKALLNP